VPISIESVMVGKFYTKDGAHVREIIDIYNNGMAIIVKYVTHNVVGKEDNPPPGEVTMDRFARWANREAAVETDVKQGSPDNSSKPLG